MQTRTVQLRRQVIDAAHAIQARGEYPSACRVAAEIGLRPTQKTTVSKQLRALKRSGALATSVAPVGRTKGAKDKKPRLRRNAKQRWAAIRTARNRIASILETLDAALAAAD